MTDAREMTLHELLRNQHVKRWHIVHTDRQQTVAEHLWAVTMIGWELDKRIGTDLPFETWTKLLLKHDATESITGDLPTPAKRLLIGGGESLGYDISKEYAALDMWSSSYMGGLPRYVLKCADLIEAVRFMDQHGRGAHAESVRDLLFRALQLKTDEAREKFPSYEWDQVAVVFNQSLAGPDGYTDGLGW